MTGIRVSPRPWLRRRPALVRALAGYTRRTAVADLVAGVSVGIIALPLAMAFAISSGLAPQAGIYTAIVAGGLISALGGSRLQVGGPTGAFVVIVFNIVTTHGVDGLLVCTLMAGVMLIGLGVTGMGSAVRFIPRPVVVGFTNGIAILIASTQIRDLFGLQIDSVPGDFLPRIRALVAAASTWTPAAAMLAAAALIMVVASNRWMKRVPGTILALVVCTAFVAVSGIAVDTIGSRFGGIPSGLPTLRFPHVTLALLGELLVPAMTVAMLGAIESLMSATVADRLSGDRHDSNMELIAQGVANLASPLVGGLPATGAIARTAANIRLGAQTPVAGIVHALTLLAILAAAAPLARFVPLSVLAALLLVVAYHMGDWKEIGELLRLTRTDIAVWLVTVTLTVFADLTVAVGVGMVCAALLFIKRVADTTTVAPVTDAYVEEGQVHVLQNKVIPPYVRVYRVHGPFLFGATDKLSVVLDNIAAQPETVVLRLRNMTALDATGLGAFEQLADALRRSGRSLVLCGAAHQPARLIARADFHRRIGDANICANISEALTRAADIHRQRAAAATDLTS